MLLFISNAVDVHTDWVEAECEARGAPYYRFCIGEFPYRTKLTLHLEKGVVNGFIEATDATIDLSTVTGVWYRRPQKPTLYPSISGEFAPYAMAESFEMYNGLYQVLSDRRWVNLPNNNRAYRGKIFQYRLAKRLGFYIPRTLVSNDPVQVKQFFDTCHQGMIYKPMSRMVLVNEENAEHGVWTTLITETELNSNLESIVMAPCLFQERIPKAYELRINVIGANVWSTAIYSQEQSGTQLDYRLDLGGCRHEAVIIPHQIRDKCVEMNQQMGLRMSNFDFIVTPDDDYIFLETNVNGQWAWIEKKVGLPLCQALVDELLGIDTLQHHPYRIAQNSPVKAKVI